MNLKIFYSLVGIFTTIDLMINIGLIWSSLAITGTPLLIGLVLCVSVIAPFLFKKILSSKKNKRQLKQTFLYRILSYVAIGTLFLVFSKTTEILIIISAFIGGVINYITISDLETINTLYVLNGQISKKTAAKIIETGIQFGACLGSFLGGILIDNLSLNEFMIFISTMAIITAAIALFFNKGIVQSPKNDIPANKKQESGISHKKNNPKDWIIIFFAFGMGMIGFHIGSFNILVPVVYQKLNLWTASQLGTASAIAGVGAFLSSLIPNRKTWIPFICMILIISDVILVSSRTIWISIGICFLIGLSINYIRIALREQLIMFSINEFYAHKIASLSMFNYLFFRGGAPLLVSLLVSNYLFGIYSARTVFIGIGILSASIFFAMFLKSKKNVSTSLEIANG